MLIGVDRKLHLALNIDLGFYRKGLFRGSVSNFENMKFNDRFESLILVHHLQIKEFLPAANQTPLPNLQICI